MKLYIAGPMSHIPRFNIPAFDEAAAVLRAMGHTVINPAEEDSPAVRERALASLDGAPAALEGSGETWGDMLARDVKLIADHGIEGVALLPFWYQSRGARLEAFIALLCNIDLFTYEAGRLAKLERRRAVKIINRSFE